MQFYLRLALNIKKVYQKIATGSMKMAKIRYRIQYTENNKTEQNGDK